MKSLFFSCLYVLLLAGTAIAQPEVALRKGDLLFQDLDCGGMCDAIEAVTQGFRGQHFSHVGIVDISGDSVMVIEAIGVKVQRIPLAQFRARNKNTIWLGRVREHPEEIGAAAVSYARRQIGKPYDGLFRMDEDKFYCSELVYDAFREANDNKPFFTLNPMTFREPGKQQFFPVWEQYFKELGQAPPEGEPGINPGGISRSERLDIFPLK